MRRDAVRVVRLFPRFLGNTSPRRRSLGSSDTLRMKSWEIGERDRLNRDV